MGRSMFCQCPRRKKQPGWTTDKLALLPRLTNTKVICSCPSENCNFLPAPCPTFYSNNAAQSTVVKNPALSATSNFRSSHRLFHIRFRDIFPEASHNKHQSNSGKGRIAPRLSLLGGSNNLQLHVFARGFDSDPPNEPSRPLWGSVTIGGRRCLQLGGPLAYPPLPLLNGIW